MRLNLDSLNDMERRAVRIELDDIIALELESSSLVRSQMKRPSAKFVVNCLIKRELGGKISSEPIEAMVQLGLKSDEIHEAYLRQYEDGIV
jgi:hypothetical protein